MQAVEINDTHTTLNIRTSNNIDLKLISGASTFKTSALKKASVRSPKKGLNIKIPQQYLSKPDTEKYMRFNTVFEVMHKVLPETIKKLVKKEVH